MMRLKGKVKFFNQQKGYGFIHCPENEHDYFVHISDVEGETLLEAEDVAFKPVEGHKGEQAIEVERINPPVMQKEYGVMAFYNEERGFGFISREGKADVFAHFSDFKDIDGAEDIVEGMEVEFTVRQGRDGRDRAYQIYRLD